MPPLRLGRWHFSSGRCISILSFSTPMTGLRFFAVFAFAFPLSLCRAAPVIETDVCVYGGTSGGAVAGVTAARLGKTVALVSFNNHIGGMTSGGLGVTDK